MDENTREKVRIESSEIGSLEEILGENDPLFQIDPEDQAHLDSIAQEVK